ncbi:LysR family transcriptional regulator [Kitasatospora sp. NBC_01287]|uniref:LysR family transcriptional regulator n=1 Tax=Kitasatospora sp. NBC_01287 TaxID=2903573 RepID=UPI002252DE36|nr:LysR family transcriptional regulator [Kitasatospora sp. NBC_01287]MCX4747898.1 LysR family transcriptional regulator [Kitasatospora sp. NBC_01287]
MNDLAIRELRILVAVERAGSFTAAAEALGLTQSAVSHAVSACERKIGTVLFDRGRHGARPTAAGVRAAAHARRILRLLDALPDEARGASTQVLSGPLRIAAFRTAAVHLLPTVLSRIKAAHPGLAPEVRIVPEVGRGTAGEVQDGRADLGIATLSGSYRLPEGLVAGELFEEAYSLVHPAGHTDPRTLPLIDWTENCSSYTREWWAVQDWLPATRLDAGEDSVVLSMVAGGMGMAVMPRLALLDAPATVAVTDLGAERPTRTVGYVTTPELARTLGVRALIRELRGAAAAGVAA